jgi:hypothetical protein
MGVTPLTGTLTVVAVSDAKRATSSRVVLLGLPVRLVQQE